MNKYIITILIAVLTLTTSSVWADIDTFDPSGQKDVVEMVRKAMKLLSAKGDAALPVIQEPEGEFINGVLYVFVYDTDINMLAHPAKPELVGKNFKGIPDINGKMFRDEIVRKALSGGGWTDYYYQNPSDKKIELKHTLSKLVVAKGKKYVVCAGAYEHKD